ncbi:MAG: copper transport protein [Actinomycetota bacterium]|jgi:methionine-rich copper-binding protein CopC|nr:copper transport protein [Actinomycetota bacterium]
MPTTLRLASRAATVVLLLFGLGITPASAHVSVKSTSPTAGTVRSSPPRSVSVTFSGPIRGGTLRVVGPHGTTASRGSGGRDPRNVTRLGVDLRSRLGAGRYTARWSVVAADGHAEAGLFRFRVRR